MSACACSFVFQRLGHFFCVPFLLIRQKTRKIGTFFRMHSRKRRYAHVIPFQIWGNNCVAGRLYHDLGWPFLTPTINLWMSVHDFVSLYGRFLQTNKLPEIQDVSTQLNLGYPVGRTSFGETIHFLHYPSFEDAMSAWCRRASRIRSDILSSCVVVDNSDCSEEDIRSFLALPSKKRMVVHDEWKARLLGSEGSFCPCSAEQKGNLSFELGWTGRWLYQRHVPFSWLLDFDTRGSTFARYAGTFDKKGRNPIPHILFVSVRFPPSVGGLQAAGKTLLAGFLSLGYRITLLTTTLETTSCPEFDVIHAKNEKALREKVLQTISSICPDLVFVNGHQSHSIYSVLPRKSPIPVVFRSHGIDTTTIPAWHHPPFFGIPKILRNYAQAFYNVWVGRGFAQEVFLDKSYGITQNFDVLLADFLHPGNVSYIPNSSADLSLPASTFRAMYGIPPHALLCLNVANYAVRKGQVDIVRILLQNPHLDVFFVFIGGCRNEMCDKVMLMAKEDKRILCLWNRPRREVVEAINACDIAVMFSRQEQQPLFLLEAMSCRKPWISSDVGSIRKMKGGIVLRKRSSRRLIRAIHEMEDPRTRAALGEEARRYWEQTANPETVFQRWKTLIEDVIQGHPRNGY